LEPSCYSKLWHQMKSEEFLLLWDLH